MKLPFGSTIYIAGPMRGYPQYNYEEFFYWSRMFRTSGYKVLNPAAKDVDKWLDDGWVFSEDEWELVIEEDLQWIKDEADALFMLHGWEDSEGANMEKELADDLDLPVFFEDDRQ